jgi:hypothetical protein
VEVSIAKQQLVEILLTAVNTNTIVEEHLDALFFNQSGTKLCEESQQ